MSGTSSLGPIGGIEVADDSGEDCLVTRTGSVASVGATVAVIADARVDGMAVAVSIGWVDVDATPVSVSEQALNINKIRTIKNSRLT